MRDQHLKRPLKPYSVFYFVPALMLSAVLMPWSFKQQAMYLSLCILVVGCFALLFALGYSFMFEAHQRNNAFALIMLVIMLFFNPIVLKYSLALKLEALNHQFLIFCNLCTAAIFIYLWWDMRHKKRRS